MKKPPGMGISIALKVGIFAFLEIAGLAIFGQLLGPLIGIFPASATSVFAAAALANLVAMRIYEQAPLMAVGFAWNSASVRNLLIGLGGGIGAACVILAGPLAAGGAELVKTPENASSAGTIAFVLVMLVIGGIGEEMLFHGYGFQVLLKAIGPWATIIPVSVLFGLAHGGNPNISRLALVNTVAWGVVLGYAFWRSGDLWLPIGLHVGWNWILPLFGANLSGFTMNVTGYAMRWKVGPLWSGGEYGPEAGLLTLVIAVLLFFFLWKAPIRRQEAFLLRSRSEA